MSDVLIAKQLSASVRLHGAERLPILEDVSLEVAEGASAAILGRSGSGKSTLLAILGLMSRPDSGELLIAGRDVSSLHESDAARLRNSLIGFVFQSYSLIEHLSVRENVELPFAFGERERHRVIRRATRKSLALVGMAGFEARMPAQLSGGEQQRVAIARALVRSPSLILADEPTGALDVDTGEHVMSVLLDATAGAESGLVVVTHDASIASSLGSQWRLDGGRLHEAPLAQPQGVSR